MASVSIGYREGARLAKTSSLVLVLLGFIEILIGWLTGSVGLSADGVDSISDAMVSLLVWFGLRVSSKAPSEKFRFGYYKVENLVALFTAIGLIGIAGVIFYRSYLAFLNPHPLELPALALAVLLIAGTISTYRALQMRKVADKYNLSSLRLDASNALKDGAASFLVFFTVFASSLGFYQMDAIGGMIVGIFIITVSYIIIKESSLVLLDAYHDPSTVEMIKDAIQVHHGGPVKDILLRPAGPLFYCEIQIEVDPDMSVRKLNELTAIIEDSIRRKFPEIQRIIVTTRTHH